MYGLIQELLNTVKGLRKEQKHQKDQIEELTKQVQNQQAAIRRLRGAGQPSSCNDTVSLTTESGDNDLANLRRKLVGMIGTAMAQHEEDFAAALSRTNTKCQCQCQQRP